MTPTDPGRSWRLASLLAFTAFTAILGALLRNPQFLALSEALAAVLALSGLRSWYALRSLEVTRSVPESAFEDEWIPARLEVRNRGVLGVALVELHDAFAGDALSQRAALIPGLRAGEARSVTFERPCARGRGVFGFGPVELAVNDPLGLFRFRRLVELPDELVVYPRPLPLSGTGVESTLRLAFSGSAVRPRPGHTTEFMGLREVRPGEAAQRIHWRASARLQRLVSTEFEAPSRTEVCFFLDLAARSHRGVGRGSNHETALRLAAAVAKLALDQGNRFRLVAQSEEPIVLPARTGRAHLIAILDTLARAQPRGEVDYLDLLEEGASLVPDGGALVLAFSRYHLEPEAAERLLGLWAVWRRRGVSALALVVDDRELVARDWSESAAKAGPGEPLPEFLSGLGLPHAVVQRAEELAEALA